MKYEDHLTKTRELIQKHVNLFGPQSFDISILPGWMQIVESVLDKMQEELKDKPNAQIKILQIKEKFGGLRLYFRSENLGEESNKRLWATHEAAEAASLLTCVVCGAPGKRESPTGWISVKCEKHSGLTFRDVFEDDSTANYSKHEDLLDKILKRT